MTKFGTWLNLRQITTGTPGSDLNRDRLRIQKRKVWELYVIRKMSSNTIRKAKKLVENNCVVKIEDDLYQIKSSSDPNKSYFVTSDSCECPGFKNFYKFHHGKGLKANCSHLEALRIFKKENQ